MRVVLLSLLGALGGGVACAEALSTFAWQGETMGSVYTVKVVDARLTDVQLSALKAEVDARLREVNRQMSHYDPESELSRFNRAPARTPFKVSAGFARVVRFSLELNRRSRGAFDPTLAPLINLWGFGEKTHPQEIPPEAEIRAALQRVGCQHLTVTDQDELTKDLPELTVNLSAVAKGFGVDEMVAVLRGHGLTNVYASIAGDVRTAGHNPRGGRWQVGISAPLPRWRETDPMAAVASLGDQAISTSGNYQKFFTDAQGRRRGHILDPRTGSPVESPIGGVSVVAPDSMTADGLDTTLYVLGLDEGMKFIESWTNAAALFIVQDGEGGFRQVPSSRFAQLAGYTP